MQPEVRVTQTGTREGAAEAEKGASRAKAPMVAVQSGGTSKPAVRQ